MKIAKIEPLVCNVSEKTNWFFVRVTDEHGTAGIGEASLNGWEPAQLAYLESLRSGLLGKNVEQIVSLLRVYPHSPGGLIASSIASALEQAVMDLRARRAGVPVHALLGQSPRKSVRVYANINRGARDRSPAGIAQSARSAVAAGFGAVKIAPFDGVYWGDCEHPDARRRVQLGIDRIYAIREAVGPDIDVMVDCHWRFDEPSALQLVRDLRAARLYWLECPISENPQWFAAQQRMRDEANRHGMKLAGAERQVAVDGFAPYIEGRMFDVVMPDIKYAGGYAEMLRIAELCARHAVHFAPHNPSGPICNLASMHLCAVAPAFLVLEYQLAESPLYFDVVGGFKPRLVDGSFEIPERPGIGADLDDAVLRAHPFRPLAANANLDPRLG